MNRIVSAVFIAALASGAGAARAAETPAPAAAGKVAARPLFRDPGRDGAADPVVIWNRAEKKWFMLYTNRRARVPPTEAVDGVTGVHGTRIGIAEASDGGATWKYRGDAAIDLPPQFGGKKVTHWAPEVFEHDGTSHMFLTVVPGIFTDWNHPRDIAHLTSKDLLAWKYESTLKLATDRVIDACVFHPPDGTWRLWYNNERDRKSIYFADSRDSRDSRDLTTFEDRGKVAGVGDRPGEGPKVFRWKGAYWMVVDVWNGLGVYRSYDALTWTLQPGNLVQTLARARTTA